MPTSTLDISSLVFFGDSLTDNGNLFALTGGAAPPSPPYFEGRFSNGPTYAEIVPGLLGVPDANFAFGGAEALTDGSEDPLQQAINLPSQLSTYLSTLPPTGAADGTAAVLNIGNNDYLRLSPTATPAEIGLTIQSVLGSVQTASLQLLSSGVDKIIFFTLPSVAVTPLGATLPPAALAGAVAIIEAHNAGLKALAAGLAASGADVEVVDIFRLANELAADKETFGFAVTDQQLLLNPGADPDSFAFFDAIHPTEEAHQVQAAFATATLLASSVSLLDAGNDAVNGGSGSDLVFTGSGNDTVHSGAGSDSVFAGIGNDRVEAGRGDDIVAGGAGNDHIWGGLGSDVLAGNRGNDWIDGGAGADALIAGGGADALFGGAGNDRLIFDEADGMTGRSYADGGAGRDVLQLNVSAETFASASFQYDLCDLAHEARWWRGLDDGEFDAIGLRFDDIERVEISVDGVLQVAFGRGPIATDTGLAEQLATADLWGLV